MKHTVWKRWVAMLLSVFMMVGLIPMSASAAQIAPPDEDNFTLLWVTDPQWYSFAYPEIITAQNNWVVDNYNRMDMRYILHTGDFVNFPNDHDQWGVMDKAYKAWDNAGLAYGVLAGNHDVDGSDHSTYSQYFGRSRFAGKSWYGDDYEDNFGHYDLMTIDGVKFIFAYMGYNSSYKDADYEWLNQILSAHSDRIAILNFHDYLSAAGTRSPNGEAWFQRVVLKNPNVRMVLCGHNYNSTRLVEEIDDNGDGVADRTCYQMMANYQSTTNGGNGFMRFMECDVKDGYIKHRTYSPYTESFGSDYEDGTIIDEYGYRDEFAIPFDFSAPTGKKAGDPEYGSVVVSPRVAFFPTASTNAITLPVTYQNVAEKGTVYNGIGVYDRHFSVDATDAFTNYADLNYIVAKYSPSVGYEIMSVARGAWIDPQAQKPLVPIPQDSLVIAIPASADIDVGQFSVGHRVNITKMDGITTPTVDGSVTMTVGAWNTTYNINDANRLAANDEWIVYDSLCQKSYSHEWDMLYAFTPVSGNTYKITASNTTLGTPKSLAVPSNGFVLAVNMYSAREAYVQSMRTLFTNGLQVTLDGYEPGKALLREQHNLLAPSVSAWNRDASLLTIEQGDGVQVMYNTNSQWPPATYTYASPITFDPATYSVYYDYMIETGSQTNIQLHFKTSTPAASVSNQYVRIHKYFDGAYISSNSGDAKGDDVRRSGTISLKNVDIPAECYNDDGTLTLNGITIAVAGNANKKQYYYDLSLFANTAVDENSLAQSASLLSNTIRVTDTAKKGGYVYDNGKLTVTADSANGYEVVVDVNRSFNVSTLKNWLVDIQATTPFDVRLKLSSSADDVTYGMAPDFWPQLCDQTVNGYIPAGNYNTAMDLLSCFTYNGVLPAGGVTTVKEVIITLGGQGTVAIDGLQVSNGKALGAFADGLTASENTPTYVLGDVTKDGAITTSDARYAMLHAIGAVELTGYDFMAADYNENGEITTTDARLIIQYALTH